MAFPRVSRWGSFSSLHRRCNIYDISKKHWLPRVYVPMIRWHRDNNFQQSKSMQHFTSRCIACTVQSRQDIRETTHLVTRIAYVGLYSYVCKRKIILYSYKRRYYVISPYQFVFKWLIIICSCRLHELTFFSLVKRA